MTLKSLKSLKMDVTGKVMSSFKPSKFYRNMRPDLFFSLKKELRNRKFKKRTLSFKVKNLLAKVNPSSISSNKKDLDFNSINSRNVFLRTKRKSSYGQTLLEKQRLKRFLPRPSECYVKKTFYLDSKIKNTDKKLHSFWDNISFVFSSSNIFDSSDYIYNKNIYGEFFYQNQEHSLYSFRQEKKQSNIGIIGLKLSLVKGGKGNLHTFDRILPNNMIQDLRLNKIKILQGNTPEKLLPFDFDIEKVIQHYRLRRN